MERKLPRHLLGSMEPEMFLRAYWQKKPVLIRQGLPGWQSPLEPEELAGLACEEDVIARIILEKGGSKPWELRYGPFDEEDFTSLPETHWTLLVQEVDRLVPEVAALLNTVRFLPNWRLDDIMVSYAAPEGSVGAHIDQYDVFLVQGYGKRLWQIGLHPVEEERLVEGLDVRILADFQPEAEWVVEPGDVLYLPPRYAHYGVALEPSITYSIGFRAPDQVELVTGFAQYLAEIMEAPRRYSDPDLTPTDDPGEISARAVERLHTLMLEAMKQRVPFARWVGMYATAPQRGTYPTPPEVPYTEEELVELLAGGSRLQRSAVPALAYMVEDDETVWLFAFGEAYRLPGRLREAASTLTGTVLLDYETLAPFLNDPAFIDVLLRLVNRGYLYLETS